MGPIPGLEEANVFSGHCSVPLHLSTAVDYLYDLPYVASGKPVTDDAIRIFHSHGKGDYREREFGHQN
jgi:hypothetical protein